MPGGGRDEGGMPGGGPWGGGRERESRTIQYQVSNQRGMGGLFWGVLSRGEMSSWQREPVWEEQ